MTINAVLLNGLYFSPVTIKLGHAENLYRLGGDELLQGKELVEGIELLRSYAMQLNDHMLRMAMGERCTRCAAEDGGCCSLYMAGETDALQMLMNLLAGVPVEQVRDDGEHCSFLGERGCIFLFKPMFCLNYNCSHIRNSASPADLRELERLSGRQLGKQSEVEQKLLELVAQALSA